ncbi:MAG TPA: tripartite tricarboxylate transporter TctB family protein [Methylomirabilota bacterium]|nr:tripartite tricarboxylate transporter TctB family protein [Methylomirabilota bacterium]
MRIDRASGVALVLLAAAVLEESWRLRLPLGTLATPGPAYMPAVLAAGLLAAGVLVAALSRSTATLGGAGWSEWRHSAAILATCAFVALALERLGYRLTIALACVVLLAAVERKPVLPALLFAAGLAGGTYYLFDTVLRVQLPRGPFGF